MSDFKVEDAENYRKQELTIKTIILEQYLKCCLEGSKEMTRGGVKKVYVKGELVENEIPNQREIFCNTVKIFEIILLPIIREDKILYDKLKAVLKKMDDLNISFEADCKISPNKMETLSNNYQMAMVRFAQDKLIVLSDLLKLNNYFDEGSAVGGIEY